MADEEKAVEKAVGRPIRVLKGTEKQDDGTYEKKWVEVRKESDLTPEITLKPPEGGRDGRIGITVDGQKIVFDSKTKNVTGTMKHGRFVALAMAMFALLLGLAFTPTARAQGPLLGRLRTALEYASVDAPVCLKPSSGLVINCYQGNVYLGAGAVLAPATVTTNTVGGETATQLTATASMASCPATGGCNYIYVDSSGVLHITTSLVTANSASTAVLYYVATGTASVTMIQPVWRDTNGSLASTSTGSGAPVLATTPTLTTPTINTPNINSATTILPTPIAAAATLAPTCAVNSGARILLGQTGGEVVTLPAPSVGCYFDFIITVSNTTNSNEIRTDAGTHFLIGAVEHSATGIAPLTFWADGTSIQAIKMDGAHLGGLVGSQFHVEAINSTQWLITGRNECTATCTTAFNATP